MPSTKSTFVSQYVNTAIKKGKKCDTSREIRIGDKTFDTINAAREYIQSLFVRVGATDSLKTHNTKVFTQFISLLLQHPEAERKRINETVDLKIIQGYKDDIYHMKLVFEDGSEDSVSYISCLQAISSPNKNKNTSSNKKLYEAMRNAVYPQIRLFAQQHPEKKCELCGVSECSKEYHVDHAKLFIVIAEEFLATHKQIPQTFDKQSDHLGISRTSFELKDDAFSREWQQFHQKCATLRWLCSTCNLTRSKKE
jgi:hypothetical protein